MCYVEVNPLLYSRQDMHCKRRTDYFTHTHTSIRTCYSPAWRKIDEFVRRVLLLDRHRQLFLMFLYDYYLIIAQLKRLHDAAAATAVADGHTDAEEGERVRFILSWPMAWSL